MVGTKRNPWKHDLGVVDRRAWPRQTCQASVGDESHTLRHTPKRMWTLCLPYCRDVRQCVTTTAWTDGHWWREATGLTGDRIESKGSSSGRPELPVSVLPAACRARPNVIATKNAHFAFLATFLTFLGSQKSGGADWRLG